MTPIFLLITIYKLRSIHNTFIKPIKDSKKNER